MNFLESVLLGLIQGLTEFLPISSTAHLTIAGRWLGLIDPNNPEAWTQFIAVMQLGTLAAVLVYFWRDLLGMARDLVSDVSTKRIAGWRQYSPGSWLALYIVVGTLPVALIGFALKHIIEGALTKSIPVIAGSLIVLALLLWLAEKVARHQRNLGQVTWVDALVIGCAQVLALIPGSSRSGTTITAALFLGLTRETAARFSFLLSIPAVFASGIYELIKIDWSGFQPGITGLVLATVVSFVSGYLAIAWLLKYLMKNTTMVFVWYRLGLGILLVLLLHTGSILP